MCKPHKSQLTWTSDYLVSEVSESAVVTHGWQWQPRRFGFASRVINFQEFQCLFDEIGGGSANTYLLDIDQCVEYSSVSLTLGVGGWIIIVIDIEQVRRRGVL